MLLEVRGATKTFSEGGQAFRALGGVSVRVAPAEAVGVIGESGSGKSTLANVICALELADAGTMTFDGAEMDLRAPLARKGARSRESLLGIQLIWQHPQATFSDRMRVGRAIEEGLIHRPGVSRAQARERMLAVLSDVGLPADYANRYAWQLSGGEAQRAAIARAIISCPKLLVCDEPTSALDVTVQAQIVQLIKRLCDERGMACLFISHDLALVRALCSRAYVMRAGRVVEEGPCVQLFERPQDPYTRDLVAAIPVL